MLGGLLAGAERGDDPGSHVADCLDHACAARRRQRWRDQITGRRCPFWATNAGSRGEVQMIVTEFLD
jgi:hypothetical protein